MRNLTTYNNFYFVGIGGIGMSALALWFARLGKQVAGYDRVASEVTNRLQQNGVAVTFNSEVDAIPQSFIDPDTTLVVYTPAVPQSHPQISWFRQQGFSLQKRAQVLGLLTQNHYCVAVAGTHGKTTTSSMITHLLAQAGLPVVAFIGGILQNYNSNLVAQGDAQNAIMVVEADEFDRSFLQLKPNILVITNVEPDHLDIYQNEQNLVDAFVQLTQQVAANGHLLMNHKTQQKLKVPYALAYGHCTHVIADNSVPWTFNYNNGQLKFENLQLHLLGKHNLDNMEAAISVSLLCKAQPQLIAQAVNSYQGVLRRFQVLINSNELLFVDDYAHHPTEINALIDALQRLKPEATMLLVFQPHLFTRTRDFMDGFAQALSRVHQVVLLDIYPAREEPITGVSSLALKNMIKNTNVSLITKDQLNKFVANSNAQVIATVGAGDIDRLVEPLKNTLLTKLNNKTTTII